MKNFREKMRRKIFFSGYLVGMRGVKKICDVRVFFLRTYQNVFSLKLGELGERYLIDKWRKCLAHGLVQLVALFFFFFFFLSGLDVASYFFFFLFFFFFFSFDFLGRLRPVAFLYSFFFFSFAFFCDYFFFCLNVIFFLNMIFIS